MKILLVHNYYQIRGGEDDFVDMLHKLLIKKGHKVYLYSKKSSDLITFRSRITSSLKLITSTNNEVGKIISEFQPDICHIHNIFPSINFSIINECLKRKIAIIQTIHDYRYLCLNGALYRNGKSCSLCLNSSHLPGAIHRCYHSSLPASISLMLSLTMNLRTIKKIDKFIYPNHFSYDLFSKYLNFDQKKSVIIPHFVPKVILKKSSVKKNYFIYLGRLSSEKGILELVDFFRKEKKIRLIIIGTGPLAKYCHSLRENNIRYLGYVPTEKKYKLLQEAKFSIIPSRVEEQGPLTLLESFMCGTPVIAPNFSSLVEKIPISCGFLYETSIQDGLHSAMNRAITLDKQRYKTMQNSVLNEFKEHYSEDIHYKRLISIYESTFHSKN